MTDPDRPTFLLLETIHPDAREELEAVGAVVLAETVEEVRGVAATTPVHAILTRGRGEVRESLMRVCPALRVVARVGDILFDGSVRTQLEARGARLRKDVG